MGGKDDFHVLEQSLMQCVPTHGHQQRCQSHRHRRVSLRHLHATLQTFPRNFPRHVSLRFLARVAVSACQRRSLHHAQIQISRHFYASHSRQNASSVSLHLPERTAGVVSFCSPFTSRAFRPCPLKTAIWRNARTRRRGRTDLRSAGIANPWVAATLG